MSLNSQELSVFANVCRGLCQDLTTLDSLPNAKLAIKSIAALTALVDRYYEETTNVGTPPALVPPPLPQKQRVRAVAGIRVGRNGR